MLRILRPGAVTAEMITESTGLNLDVSKTAIGVHVNQEEIRVSGLLESHYAPKARVILDQTPIFGQGLIAMADMATPDGVIRLAEPKSHNEFAKVLYSALRAADEEGLFEVVVEQPQGDGIAIAINDRLSKSAFEK